MIEKPHSRLRNSLLRNYNIDEFVENEANTSNNENTGNNTKKT